MILIPSSPMCRATMQAYTRPFIYWGLALALCVAVIAGHQYWIAAELHASIQSGGIVDPADVFPRIRLLAYLVEGFVFLLCTAGFLQSTVKFLHAVHRRRRYSQTKPVLMPGRCS